jgi:uncharacterized protein YodC (DUF2158 family)
MEATIKPGKIVKLKSGGPKMTVARTGKSALTGEDTVWRDWFDGIKKFEETFAPEALELAAADV